MNSKASIPIEIEIKREPQQAHHNQPQQQLSKSSPRHYSSLKITTTTTTKSTSAAATTTTSSKTKPTAKENNSQFVANSISSQNQNNKRFLKDFENQFVEKVFTNDHFKLNNRNIDDNKYSNMQNMNRQSSLKNNTHSKQQYQHLQNLSPIKPSFVNLKEETTPLSAANNHQFVHSTPNHHFYPNLNEHNFVATSTARSNSLSPPKYMSRLTKKQMIVKELAVNILELNGYRTRTQQLDNELNNFNRIRKENQTSSKDYVDLTEKTEDIKSELEKLKSDMLRKIDDIRGLEQELVKIEGQNISTANRNASHMQIHRNEEVMNEIKNMLKDMMGNDANAATSTIQTVSQVYEEYHKSTMNNRELVRGMKSPSQTKARSLSSSHEKTTINSCNLAEIFRIKIEQKYAYIKSQSKALEDFLSKCEDNQQRLYQIECFTSLVRSIQENLNNEKHSLFVELKNQPIYLNPIIMNNLKNNIENLLNEKLVETEKLIDFFYAQVDCKENIQLVKTVLNNNSQNNNSESSFLTEEEECIKKISERIVQLKERIHLKETQPKYKKSKGFYNDLSSDDSDTKELKKLNEQIRVLKSRMIAKGDQLNKIKKLSTNDVYVYQHSTAIATHSTTTKTKNTRPSAIPSSGLPTQSIHTSASNQFPQACTGPIYLPINHQPRRTYKIEPLLNSNAEFGQQETRSDLKGSPSRKYISSIEIPAEQLEELKNQRTLTHRRRTKSMSSTTSDEDASEHSQNHQKHRKRHNSVVHFKNVHTEKELNSKNLLQVSLKSMKLAQPEKQTMTEENSESERNKRENEQLRADLNEKETLIEKLKEQLNTRSTEISENFNKLIEQQKTEIVNLKNALNSKKEERKTIKNISVQTEQKNIANLIESSLMCNIPEHHNLEDIVHENREQIANLKSYLKKVTSQSNRFNDDDVDDLDLIEKRAEFEALDLAINERKQQLLNLEFYNRRKRRFKSGSSNHDMDEPDDDDYSDEQNQDYSFGSSVNRFIQDEIACIEKTLKKRNQQLRQIESEIRSARKELVGAKNQKKLVEKETECLKKRNSKFSQEACIFDKKAEEATVELILAQEELKKVKEQKENLESDIEDLKVQLLNYLKQLKSHDPMSSQQQQINLRLRRNSHNYLLGDYESIESIELKQSINEQRQVLQMLNEEIIAKKREIDSLKDKSESYVQQFKSEQRIHENSLNQIKQQTDDLNTKYVNLKQKLEDLSNEIRVKMDTVHEKSLEMKHLDECLNRLKSQNDEEQKKLEKLEKLIDEKEEHLDTLQSNQQKFIENLELIENNKIELLKTMEKLNNDFKLEKLNYEQTKKLNDDLIQTKNNLELKIQHLNEEFSKLSADYDHRDQQINKLKVQIKEKQQLLKREEDILSELFYEKENLIEQIDQLKDRHKKKENELKRVEETNKQLENKLNANQQEAQELLVKVNNLKYELDTNHENLKQTENRLKELNSKIQNKQVNYEQLDENFNQKRSEMENMDLYVHEIKNQIQQESKQLLAIQAENGKQKKTNDELKLKAKNLNRILESSENLQATIHELQESLSDKSRLVEQKEIELKEKDKEIEQLIRDFLRVQEEAKVFSSQLRQLEEALGHHSSSSHSSSIQKRDSIYSKHPSSMNTLQPKSLISSLLITPNINKSRARSCCSQSSNNDSACCKDSNNYASYESKLEKNHENNCCLDEQERLKHQLAQNFKENEFIFERGKTQTQNVLDNLKLSLNEIELLTANNIFQITNLSKS